jgi:hypothetical protein
MRRTGKMKKLLLLFLPFIFIISCAYTPATKPLEIDKPHPIVQPKAQEEELPFIVADKHEGKLDIRDICINWVKVDSAVVNNNGVPMFVGVLGNPKIDWSVVDLDDEQSVLSMPIPEGELTTFVIVFLIETPNGVMLIGYTYNTKDESVTYTLNSTMTKYMETAREPFAKPTAIKGINI